MIRRPPRSTQGVSSAASDVYKRQVLPPESTPRNVYITYTCTLTLTCTWNTLTQHYIMSTTHCINTHTQRDHTSYVPFTEHTITTRLHTITSTRVTQHANIIHTCHRRVVHHVFVPVRRHCEVNVVPVLGRSPESPSHQPIRCFPAATVLTMQTRRPVSYTHLTLPTILLV